MFENHFKINSTKGQSIVEWGIAVLLVSVVTMSVLFAFAPEMKGILNKIQGAIYTNNNVAP